MSHADPCDMGSLLRAACDAYRAAHPGTSQAAVARLAGLDPASLSRALTRPDAEPRLVRAVCLALGLRVALVEANPDRSLRHGACAESKPDGTIDRRSR